MLYQHLLENKDFGSTTAVPTFGNRLVESDVPISLLEKRFSVLMLLEFLGLFDSSFCTGRLYNRSLTGIDSLIKVM